MTSCHHAADIPPGGAEGGGIWVEDLERSVEQRTRSHFFAGAD
jgi:hypothetical protein